MDCKIVCRCVLILNICLHFKRERDTLTIFIMSNLRLITVSEGCVLETLYQPVPSFCPIIRTLSEQCTGVSPHISVLFLSNMPYFWFFNFSFMSMQVYVCMGMCACICVYVCVWKREMWEIHVWARVFAGS